MWEEYDSYYEGGICGRIMRVGAMGGLRASSAMVKRAVRANGSNFADQCIALQWVEHLGN